MFLTDEQRKESLFFPASNGTFSSCNDLSKPIVYTPYGLWFSLPGFSQDLAWFFLGGKEQLWSI